MKANPILDAPEDAFVCYCGGVSKKTLLKAIAAGHDSIEKLKKVTNICPVDHDCERNNPSGKCCLSEVNALLRSHVKTPLKGITGSGCSCCG